MGATMLAAQPVGLPGLAALVAGGFLFGAAVVRARLTAPASERGGERAGASVAGILLQMVAFASTGSGPVRIELDPVGTAALAQGLVVAALFAAAVALFLAATRAMGETWSLVARTRADHRLVTEGVFARIRHPIYLAMGLFLAGLAVGLGHEANLLFALPLFALGTAIRVRAEERLLAQRFGEAYRRYAAGVKRFVPGLF